MLFVIAALLLVVLVVTAIVRAVQIIPQATAAVVERLGRFKAVEEPGLVFLVPFVDKIRARIDLREQVRSFPPQPVITKDNLTVNIDTVVYYQVTDPKSAVYEIADYINGVEQTTTTTLRNVVGGLSLEETLTARDEINSQLRGELDKVTGGWGIRIARVEIKAIEPPASIQESMERQMKADREKRAMILTAEGQRESAIRSAEGNKQSQILTAEGAKQAAILNAEADRQSRILRAQGERAAQYLQAQGEAKAIEKVFAAIKSGAPPRSCSLTSTCRRCRRWRRATRTRCGSCRRTSARPSRASRRCSAPRAATACSASSPRRSTTRLPPGRKRTTRRSRTGSTRRRTRRSPAWWPTRRRRPAPRSPRRTNLVGPRCRRRRLRPSCRTPRPTGGWGCPPGPTTARRRSGPRRGTGRRHRRSGSRVRPSGRPARSGRPLRTSVRRVRGTAGRVRRTGRRGRCPLPPTLSPAPWPRSGVLPGGLVRPGAGDSPRPAQRVITAARRYADRESAVPTPPRGVRRADEDPDTVEHVNPARPGYPSPPRSPRN